MMTKLARRFTATALTLACAATLAAEAPKPDAVTLQPRACPADAAALRGATCLQALVPEDPDQPDGRRIGLDIVILKAADTGAHADTPRPPLFVLEGGPGDRATEAAGREARAWAVFGRTHDLVFVDQRGTGTTPELACPPNAEALMMSGLWPAAPLPACAQALAAHADGDLHRVQQRLAAGPLVLRRADGELAIAPGLVASYLRSQLYSATGAATLPRHLHGLSDARLDQVELGKIAAWRQDAESGSPVGQYLAITCAEDVPFVDADAERRAAAGTLLGRFRIDQQVAACRAWRHAGAAAAMTTPPATGHGVDAIATLHTPVAAATPTLALVGEFDPATPPELAPTVVSALPNGRAIVVPHRGHALGEDWDACIGPVSTAFLETADATHLDTACLARLRMPAFAMPDAAVAGR